MYMWVHYLGEKIAQTKAQLAREQFGVVRLTQENGGLQWQVPMMMAWVEQRVS